MAAITAPGVHAPIGILDLGDTLQLRAEAASPDAMEKTRRWTVCGVIEERTDAGMARTYRVCSSNYGGYSVERVIVPAEILPGSVDPANSPPAPGYVRVFERNGYVDYPASEVFGKV